MTGAGDTTRPSPAEVRGGRESFYVALGLAVLYTFMLMLSDAGVLLTRPLWVDEVWTVLVSGQGSPLAVLASLANGADGGSGLVHLGAWALQKIAGVPSPVTLRVLSLVIVLAALVLVHATLRRRFSQDASVAGVLAIGSHYLVVTHAFEARFYGPWLLCCALVAFALGRHQSAPTRRRAVLLGAASVLLCTVHFYGAITLALMAAGVVASHGRRWREGLRLVAPTAAGLLAFLAILPMAIGMRTAFSVATWVPEFELRQMRALSQQFWTAKVALIGLAALLAGIAVSRVRRSSHTFMTVARAASHDAGIVALASLILVPVALAAVTLAGQPSMLPRYNIATALAWGPLFALAMELLGKWPSRIARVVLVIYWFATFVTVRFEKIVFAGDVDEAEAALKLAEAQNAPIVFQSVHTFYPVWARDRSRARRVGFLEMSDSTFRRMFRSGTVNEMYNRGLVLDRDIVRTHARRFGVPTLVSEAALDTARRFVLIAPPAHLPYGFRSIERFTRSVFPDHRVTPLDFSSALLERDRTP